MRHIEPTKSGSPIDLGTSPEEDRLRQENEDLKRRLQQLTEPVQDPSYGGPPSRPWQPAGITIWAIFLTVAILVVVAFFSGYIPRQKRRALLVNEAREQEVALPRVEVIQIGRSATNSELLLSGNIQAITEAPILARSEGYLVRRLVDIGDRVVAGQLLAQTEAPEMDEQIRQANAALQQAQAAVDQAVANHQQGKADMELARVTAERWTSLAAQGVVSKQDNDRYQAQYQSQAASVRALEKAIAVQRANVAAAEANLGRLQKIQSYRFVVAPFAGVITLRNVDVGALVTAGNTLLFRIAQTGTLRTYVNVPQTYANSVRVGQIARLNVSNVPGRQFTGTVARTASSLDPSSRTLLVEIHVPNPGGELLPGMYATVDLISARTHPPLLVPSDALIVRGEGTLVAMVRPDHSVHLQKIQVARDYGDRLEVTNGLAEGDMIIPNPGDAAREGLKVEPVPIAESDAKGPARASAGR